MCHTKIRVLLMLLATATVLLQAGCGTVQRTLDESPVAIGMDLATQGTVYINEWVHRQPTPQILIRPQEAPPTPPKALFIPFRMYQQMDGGSKVAERISGMFWQSWLQQQTFDTMQYSPDLSPFAAHRGIAAGRALGADLVISGYVTRLLAGGTNSDSRLALQVDIYDTLSGELVWSMLHAGFMEKRVKRDYLFFTQESRMPADPIWAIATALAMDMAIPIKQWQNSLSSNKSDPFSSPESSEQNATPQPEKDSGIASTIKGWFR